MRSKSFRKVQFLSILLVVPLLLLSVTSASANAKARTATKFPTIVTIEFPSNKVSAGSSFPVKFVVAGMPAGTRSYLQRVAGTPPTWKSVRQLTGRIGTVTAPGVPMGKYLYRVYSVSGQLRKASATKFLYSYGDVLFSTICSKITSIFHVPMFSGLGLICGTGTRQLGTTPTSFAYAAIALTYESFPSYQGIFSFNSTCRSMSLRFSEGVGYSPGVGYAGSNSFTTYVQVDQPSANPVHSSAAPDTIGTLTTSIVKGSWVLYTSTSGWTNYQEDVLLNGTFSCYTPLGI